MLEWVIQHQKKLSLIMGTLMLLGALGALFWKNEEGTSDELSRAAANVARMEARMQGNSAATTQKQNAHPAVEAFYESREKQLRYLLIIVVIGGVGFLIYGFLKKEP